MRNPASLVVAMEGVSRHALRIAKELAANSRSGLTTRFLAKKLELPVEEIEYLVDLNHRFLFTDLTKIKLVPEGFSAVKRISDGLENRGDVASLFRLVKALEPPDLRRIEEQVGLDRPGPKKSVVEELLNRFYLHPDSIVSYVAARSFSDTARELFDLVWQSPDGLMPVSKLRAAHGGSDYQIEMALWELFRSFSLFEIFRFDAEDRLVRVAALLSEIRQYRETSAHQRGKKTALKPVRGTPAIVDNRELSFSDAVCRLVALIAAKPARLRGDGELFREDVQRFEEVCPEGTEPPLATALWAAEGVGWIGRVDNELRAGRLDALLGMDRLGRHRTLFNWLAQTDSEAASLKVLTAALDQFRPGAWYSTLDFVRHVTQSASETEEVELKSVGNQWRYVGPSASTQWELGLTHSLEETLCWMGVAARGEIDGTSVFSITELGEFLLAGKHAEKAAARHARARAEIIVQPNFDIVVPTQDMDPLLVVSLDQFAVRSSTGQATVYTLTKESFTQAVQEGHDAGAFVEYLVAHNRGGALPANVMMTLEDWRGGMKRVRLRTLQVIESDDPLVLADLLHRRRFRKFFSEIDPHKMALCAKIPKEELARNLEKEGFVVEE